MRRPRAFWISPGQTQLRRAQLVLESLEDRIVLSANIAGDINQGPTQLPAADSLVRAGGFLYFTHSDGLHGNELWKTDGTVAGTTMVKDIVPGWNGSNPIDLVAVGDTLYFVVLGTSNAGNGTQLWKSDGSEAGTVLVKDIPLPGGHPATTGDGIGGLVDFGGTLFFVANQSGADSVLWKSDGTAGGTVAVKQIAGLTIGQNLTPVGNALFFTTGETAVDPYRLAPSTPY